MAKDIYVYEDQGWYSLVPLDGGYLLVYFLLGYDVTLGSCEGYSVGCLSVPDVFFGGRPGVPDVFLPDVFLGGRPGAGRPTELPLQDLPDFGVAGRPRRSVVTRL
jgi:hypothetical protein